MRWRHERLNTDARINVACFTYGQICKNRSTHLLSLYHYVTEPILCLCFQRAEGQPG